jgi:catechol 2,3-dioxygenase-like lactoylglutathione lyase family enzyme
MMMKLIKRKTLNPKTNDPRKLRRKNTAMIDHISFSVSNIARSRAFYRAALQVLGLRVLHERVTDETNSEDSYVCFGFHHPSFCINTGKVVFPAVHIAFTARTREQVDAFHAAALAAGGADNGPPGIRTQYHRDYYGAYVRDPDGHNIEAVCHLPVQATK